MPALARLRSGASARPALAPGRSRRRRPVAGIHVFLFYGNEDVDGRGHGRAEATPFFERLCPAMTKNKGLVVLELVFLVDLRGRALVLVRVAAERARHV